MTKDTFTKDISELFDTDCNYNKYSTTRAFTESEKTTFLSHLWEKVSTLEPTLDLTSPPAIAAMMRAQKAHWSVQDQMAAFGRLFGEEVEKRKQGVKK